MSAEEKALEKVNEEIGKWEKVIQEGLDKQEKGVSDLKGSVTAVQESINKASEKIDSLEAEKKSLEDRLAEMEVKFQKPDFGQPAEAKMATPGQRFVMSEEYQTARDRKSHKTEAAGIGSMFELKQISDSTRGDLDSDRAPVFSQRVPELFYDPGQREIRLFDIMNVQPTTSNSIEYFMETDFDPDGAKSQKMETAKKNQLAMNFEKKSANVETIAAWLPASRQVLDDAPQLQGHIDGRLTYAAMNEAERQILHGDGTDGELTGIMNAGIDNVGAAAAGDTDLDHIRKAIADVRVDEYRATGLILHPNDWAEIELDKDDNGRYIWVTVPNGGTPQLWRVPVIETTIMEEGEFLVGAFGMGAQVWDRQAATVRISDSHSDYFIRNALAILAELRLALTVYRPKAFTKGQLSTYTSS